MRTKIITTALAGIRVVTLLVLAATTFNARAESIDQLLDSTFVNGRGKAAEMAFNDAILRDPLPEYIDLGVNGADLRACKLTGINGLFCLDGKTVRTWPNPSISVDVDGTPVVPAFDVFSCEDPTLGLDDRKADTCTGLTVDLAGNIWLAGKNKGKTHSLIKVVKSLPPAVEGQPRECPAAPAPGVKSLGLLAGNDALCAFEYATGRPLLVDIDPIDGDVAENFALPGYPAPLHAVLGLEERKTAAAFLGNGTVVEIASGKQGWGLIGPEQLLGITLLQLVDVDELAPELPPQNIILVTTTIGRILARNAATGAVSQVFDIPAMRESSATSCSADAPNYAIRASSKTNLVYVTDSEYCEVVALQATVDASGTFTGLANATEAYTDGFGASAVRNLTLSTAGLASPTGITVSPGVSVDLNDCTDPTIPCPLVVNAAGEPIATLAGVQLYDYSASGLSLFQVEGIPDCRYVPYACLEPLDLTDPGTGTAGVVQLLMDEGVIVPLTPEGDPDRFNPAAQRLNITPLLPAEITELFPGEGLPDLLLSRYLRGQQISGAVPGDADSGFRFGGFFGRTQEGVIFRDTFEGVFNVGELAGQSLGCADTYGTLDWDVIGTVSERYASAADAYAATDPQHVTTIINSGCSSSKSLDDRWSLKPYNLEPTPCTFNGDVFGNWESDGECVLPDATLSQARSETADDAVYAKMVLMLMDELTRTVDQLACVDTYGENGGVAPLSASDCATVQSEIANTTDKLDKCWFASQQPKQSSGNQNCQAFDSQLTNLQSTLGAVVPVDPDVANRVGELNARAGRIRHVFETRLAPSLPDNGFCEPDNPEYNADQSCGP